MKNLIIFIYLLCTGCASSNSIKHECSHLHVGEIVFEQCGPNVNCTTAEENGVTYKICSPIKGQ